MHLAKASSERLKKVYCAQWFNYAAEMELVVLLLSRKTFMAAK